MSFKTLVAEGYERKDLFGQINYQNMLVKKKTSKRN